MKFFFVPAFLFSLQCFAQIDTLRLSKEEAIKQIGNTSAYRNTYVIVYDSSNKQVVSECNYLNGNQHGLSTVYQNGKIWWQCTFRRGLKNGDYLSYYTNGVIERKEKYVDGTVLFGTCYNDQGVEIAYFNEPRIFADEMPEMSSKLKTYLRKELIYPESAKKAKIQGTVFVKFVVMYDGTINNPHVVSGLTKECDNEAIRLIKDMPICKPGKHNGKNVNVYFTLPVTFKL